MRTLLSVEGISFDAGHFIWWHPKCGVLHGHTYDVKATLEGDIDPSTQMIVDFGVFKPVIKMIADQVFDHKMIVPAARCARWDRDLIRVEVGPDRFMVAPEREFVILHDDPTVENIAAEFAEHLARRLSHIPNLKKLSVYVSEGNAKGAEVLLDLPVAVAEQTSVLKGSAQEELPLG